jgi:septum formation protein
MLVLASASPRRRALLSEAGFRFRVVVPPVDEHNPERGDPAHVALFNATGKAMAVESEPVLAADTVVALGDRLLGKPTDDEEARAFLGLLSGTTHSVVTGVALRYDGAITGGCVETKVTMRRIEPAEIEAYVATGESRGKAGAYAIQETADRFVESIDGPYDNVVGLPVDLVRRLLEEAAGDGWESVFLGRGNR